MTSTAGAIMQALATRLESVTVAAGYTTDVKAVYHDKIPMGLELSAEQLPTLFLLDDGGTFEHEHQQMNVTRAVRVQIILDENAGDEEVYQAMRDIAKGVFANSATATVQDQFRFHPLVYWVQIDSDEGDLHMIDGNRIATFRLLVHYRTRPYDL